MGIGSVGLDSPARNRARRDREKTPATILLASQSAQSAGSNRGLATTFAEHLWDGSPRADGPRPNRPVLHLRRGVQRPAPTFSGPHGLRRRLGLQPQGSHETPANEPEGLIAELERRE